MEQNICPVCGCVHEYNTGILLNKYLKNIPDEQRITGYSLCEEHDKLFKEGYLAAVEIDATKSHISNDDTIKQENAHYTGNILHIKRYVCNQIFNREIPDDLPMVYIDNEVFTKLKAYTEK